MLVVVLVVVEWSVCDEDHYHVLSSLHVFWLCTVAVVICVRGSRTFLTVLSVIIVV